ncbi:hypothetical protein D3C81_1389150 [compost metagenome]
MMRIESAVTAKIPAKQFADRHRLEPLTQGIRYDLLGVLRAPQVAAELLGTGPVNVHGQVAVIPIDSGAHLNPRL